MHRHAHSAWSHADQSCASVAIPHQYWQPTRTGGQHGADCCLSARHPTRWRHLLFLREPAGGSGRGDHVPTHGLCHRTSLHSSMCHHRRAKCGLRSGKLFIHPLCHQPASHACHFHQILPVHRYARSPTGSRSFAQSIRSAQPHSERRHRVFSLHPARAIHDRRHLLFQCHSLW